MTEILHTANSKMSEYYVITAHYANTSMHATGTMTQRDMWL